MFLFSSVGRLKMSNTRRKSLKTILQITCHLLWLAGLVVGLSGVYLLLNCRKNSLFFSDSYIVLPAILALASAAFLLANGGLGYWVSVRESIVVQGVFVYLLVVVLCLQSTASALAYVQSGKMDSELAPLRGVFEKYTGSSQDPDSSVVDATQEQLQCCGIHGYRDWLEAPWFNRSRGLRVPQSCCNSTFQSCSGTLDQPWKLYPQGCQVKLEEALLFVLSLISWSSLPVVLVEMVGFVTVAQLMTDQHFLDYHILDRK